jgi:putative endonuclease
MSGAVGYHAGLCAEDIVATRYERGGYDLLERRWRGKGGEIDLIFGKDDAIFFVEVKKSRDFATAAARLSARQMQRIYDSAGAYLANAPGGQDTDVRFDVALVDAIGATQIIENAFGL